MMTKTELVELNDRRERWLEERRNGIGASDAPVICGVSPWSDPLTLWAEKRGLTTAPKPDLRMRMGLALEDAICDEFRRETERTVFREELFSIWRSGRYHWMQATLDATQAQAGHYDRGVLELKTTSAYRAHDWAESAPLHYQVQVQHQLAVTGYQWGSIAVLIGGQEFRWLDIERDQKFIDRLFEVEEEFWDCVRFDKAPAPNGSPSSVETLGRLHPNDNGDSVALPADAASWDAELVRLRSRIAENTSRKRELEAQIKAAIGENTFGVLPDGTRYSWKTTERKAYCVEKSVNRILRREASK